MAKPASFLCASIPWMMASLSVSGIPGSLAAPPNACGDFEVTGTWVSRPEGAYLYVHSNTPEEVELTLQPAPKTSKKSPADSAHVSLQGTLSRPLKDHQGSFVYRAWKAVPSDPLNPAAGDGFKLIKAKPCGK